MVARILVAGLSLAVLASVVWSAANPSNQWEFQTSYWAAKAQSLGKDPYDPAVLQELGGVSPGRPGFTYPPQVLPLFRPFLAMDYPQARLAYLGVKCLVLLALFWLWIGFLGKDFNAWFLLFAVLAFNGALGYDLVSGSFNLFELALLWLAFAFYVRGQDLPFAVTLLIASMFSFLPILFLGLFLFDAEPRRLGYLGGTVLAFIGCIVGATRLMPDLYRGFRGVLGVPPEPGWENQSLWAILHAVRVYLAQVVPWENPPVLPFAGVYLLVAVAVGVVTLVVGSRLAVVEVRERRTLQVCVACFAFAVVSLSMKPYSFVLLLPPAFYLLRRLTGPSPAVILGALMAIPANQANGVPFLRPVGNIVLLYSLWLGGVLLWGLFCYRYAGGQAPATATVREPPPTDVLPAPAPEAAIASSPLTRRLGETGPLLSSGGQRPTSSPE